MRERLERQPLLLVLVLVFVFVLLLVLDLVLALVPALVPSKHPLGAWRRGRAGRAELRLVFWGGAAR